MMRKYKIKSSRSILKRFKITARGKCLRQRAGSSHLLQKKTSERKRRLRRVVSVKHMDCILLKSTVLNVK